ncbi:MAG TPA: hypothetical protein VEH27_18110 [Methylomirabilota bacterium]|nr:hypothetical protein [Methylomirabilota bacterium]
METPTQLELYQVRKPADELRQRRTAALVELLRYAEDWLTAKEIAKRMLLDDRQIRDLAEHASPKVISGDKGYRHTDRATAEEITHFVNRMESQCKRMADRALAVRRYAHSRIG